MADELGTLLPRIENPPPGPRSLELARRLAEVECRNITMLSPDFPVFWEEARGANVLDVDGNVFLDLTGAFGVSTAGHTPRELWMGSGTRLAALSMGWVMFILQPSRWSSWKPWRLWDLGPIPGPFSVRRDPRPWNRR